jgi:hypothetical protein
MKSSIASLVTVSTMLLAPLPTPAQTVPPKPVESKIRWVYTYAEGKKLGKETGKPLFVVFRCER